MGSEVVMTEIMDRDSLLKENFSEANFLIYFCCLNMIYNVNVFNTIKIILIISLGDLLN